MNKTSLTLATLLTAALLAGGSASAAEPQRWVLAIHGGAGVLERGDLTPEKDKAYRAGLDEALKAGSKVLADGGSSLDAVEAAVRVMEDNPLFNAGKGAVFTAEGKNELDASIMDGSNMKAGGRGRRHPHPQSDHPGPRGHGEVGACDAGPRRRRRLLEGEGAGPGRSVLLPHRGALEAAGGMAQVQRRGHRQDPPLRYRRRGRH